MKPYPNKAAAAFTLIEIVLCLAIVSTAILALIALIPLGSDAGREASDKTVIALILEDIHKNLEGKPLAPTTTPYIFNYDGQGILVDLASPITTPRYLAEVTLSNLSSANAPAHTSDMVAARISLYWPVDPTTGDKLPATSPPEKTVTYYLTTMAGPSWQTVDPTHTPKIEF